MPDSELTAAIKKVVPMIVDEWNNIKLGQFEQLFEQEFEHYFANRQTQEKTKLAAPIIDVIFARLMKEILPEFVISEKKGQDYLFNDIPLECKITFGSGKGWVGNGYTKVDNHILMRFEIDKTGHISHYFAMTVDLSKCASKWSQPHEKAGSKANFSSLEFLTKDKEHLNIVAGTIKVNKKWLKPIMTKR